MWNIVRGEEGEASVTRRSAELGSDGKLDHLFCVQTPHWPGMRCTGAGYIETQRYAADTIRVQAAFHELFSHRKAATLQCLLSRPAYIYRFVGTMV